MSASFGEASSPTGALTRVMVRPPDQQAAESWRAYGWREAPDMSRLVEEHWAFRQELEAAGAQVVSGATPVPGNPDAIYVRDPVLVAAEGAILLRPGKPGRREEPDPVGADLKDAGVPVIGRLDEPATAEGGDMFWLDEHTLLVGRSYRTNDAGIVALRGLLPGVSLMAFDLPHLVGPSGVLHLMSLISPLDRDLMVAFPRLMPSRLVELLAERDIYLVEVPDDEFETMGPNVLALGPRIALALEGNGETRRRMEAAGVEVHTYRGEEISRKGDGGPTCLTLPLSRAAG